MTTFFHSFKEELFTTYDVRGIAFTEFTKEDAFYFGISFGLFLKRRQNFIKKLFSFLTSENPKVVVGTDDSNASFEIKEKFIEGLILTGINVIEISGVTTPIVYYGVSHFRCDGGVSITTSLHKSSLEHAPKSNDLRFYKEDEQRVNLGQTLSEMKFMLNDGPLDGEHIKEFSLSLQDGISLTSLRKGIVNEIDIIETYISEILSILQFNANGKILKVGVESSGSSILILKRIATRLPFALFIKEEQDDSTFESFIQQHNIDIGFKIDGDGDKLSGLSLNGTILNGDDLGFIVARNLLLNAKGRGQNIVLDLAFSIRLESAIKNMRGNVHFSATGKSSIMKKMKEVGAEIGIESRGSIHIKKGFCGFDDAIFAMLKIISVLSFEEKTITDILNELPFTFKTQNIRIKTAHEEEKFEVIKAQLIRDLKPERIIEAGGVKLIFENNNSAITVRVCNTEDAIFFKAEAKNIDTFIRLERILGKIKQDLLQ